MSQDTNSVTMVCRLAMEPELRQTANGTSVCNLRVAFNTQKPDGQGGYEDKGNFINVVVWGRAAEACEQHLRKGHRIAVTGRLEMNEWKAQDGSNRQQIEVVANSIGGIQFLQPREDSTAQAPASRSNDMGGGGSSWGSAPPATTGVDKDDDIPFAPSYV